MVNASWQAPKQGWVKLNTNGSSKENSGWSGGGGVLRDYRGLWISEFLAHFGFCSSMKAELLAVLHSLHLAWELGFRHLIVELDSKATLNIFSIDGDCNIRFTNELAECRELIRRPCLVQFCHTY